jgi:hypothetical protein
MFKMAKKWQQAGSAFCEAANLHAKAGSRHDAATNYVDASNCFKKVRDIEKKIINNGVLMGDDEKFRRLTRTKQSLAC